MQIATYPFTLRDGGEPPHLGLRELQRRLLTVELVGVDGRCAATPAAVAGAP